MKEPISQLEFRVATLDDARLLSELGAATFRETFVNENTPEDMAVYLSQNFVPERLEEELSDPLSTFLILELSGKPVGYAKLSKSDPDSGVTGTRPLELVRLYVLAEHIRQGAGAMLMTACLRQAESRGHDTLWLGVWERNLRAINFYNKWGFERVGSHIFQLGSDAQTDLILQKRLSP